MTRTENLERITKACVAANPEIMKLQLGCAIQVSLPHSILNTYITRVCSDWTFLLDYSPLYFSSEQLRFDKKFKILGREIQLADVLMAIHLRNPWEWAILSDGFFCNMETITPNDICWDLQKPLSSQKDDVLDFLANLL